MLSSPLTPLPFTFFPTVLPGVYMLAARLLFLGVVFEKGF